MADDIEQRLTAAAEALHEYESLTRRRADLRVELDEVTEQIAELRERYADEQHDVDRLEGLSLTRVLAALRGSRDDALARERAEAEAAHYRVVAAEARLVALRQEHDVAKVRLRHLGDAPSAYSAMLDEKGRHLADSGDPRGARLLELAAERGRLAGEVRELREATRAVGDARQALSALGNHLDSAARWSAYDTFFGGGIVGSAMKHSRLDEAAGAAAEAQRLLSRLRTELADVREATPSDSFPLVGAGVRFFDIWLDDTGLDLAVRDQIKRAQRDAGRWMSIVVELQGRIEERLSQAVDRLARLDAERRDLLGA